MGVAGDVRMWVWRVDTSRASPAEPQGLHEMVFADGSGAGLMVSRILSGWDLRALKSSPYPDGLPDWVKIGT